MKKFFVVLCMLCMSIGLFAQTKAGDQSLGFSVGYGFDTENATIGIDYRYNITDALRVSPAVSYFVKSDGLSACAIDLNAHYVIPLSDVLGFYPLAGIDLAFWKWSNSMDFNEGGRYSLSTKKTRLGVNLGLGAEVYATQELSIGLEVKYNVVKDFDQPMLALRVGYNF